MCRRCSDSEQGEGQVMHGLATGRSSTVSGGGLWIVCSEHRSRWGRGHTDRGWTTKYGGM